MKTKKAKKSYNELKSTTARKKRVEKARKLLEGVVVHANHLNTHIIAGNRKV